MTPNENELEKTDISQPENQKSDGRTSDLLYTQEDVQEIIFLSILTGMQTRDFIAQQNISSVNIDQLAQTLRDNITTVENVKALLSQPVIAVGFVFEALGCKYKTDIKPETENTTAE